MAISGDRVVVYEAGRQRLVKLELVHSRVDESRSDSLTVSEKPSYGDRPHSDADFQAFGRSGGIPLAVAVTASRDGLTVSLRTSADDAPALTLGVANATQAFKLTNVDDHRENRGTTTFQLPAGDWSNLRLAIAVELPNQRERFGFVDHRAIHAPFSDNPADWAPLDLDTYRELVEARRQEIRITFDQPTDGKATVVIEDAAGHRMRNLIAGRSFPTGRHTLVWDGLDESGKLVTPGSYRWRGITHPGIEPVYKMNFANGGEPTTALGDRTIARFKMPRRTESWFSSPLL